MSKTMNKYSPEVRERAVRMVLDNAGQHDGRGAAFPISMLESRLKCPRCDSRRVIIIYWFPANGTSQQVRA